MTSASPLGPPVNPGGALLRSYDAYAAAEAAGYDVAFDALPDGRASVLMRTNHLILIEGTLPEPQRHDELAHQVEHLHHPLRPGQSLGELETAVRCDTARRLIPVPALLKAVSAVVTEDDRADPEAVAALLGSHVCTLHDRIHSLTAQESAGAGGLLALLKWPARTPAVHRYCVQDAAAEPRWLERLLRRIRRA